MTDSSEIRSASLLSGLVALACAALIFSPPWALERLFEYMDDHVQIVISSCLAFSGSLQVLGALCENRWVRQLGLMFAAICWASLCALFITHWYFTAALIVSAFALFVLWVYVRDVGKKPRGPCRYH